MRIAIHKNVLVKTMNEIAPGEFEEWPDMLLLDGNPVDYEDDPAKIRHAQVFEVLSPIEWQIFKRLVSTGFAQHRELYAYCSISLRSMDFKGALAQHIKNLRKKLEGTDYTITAKHGFGYSITPHDNQKRYG